MIVGVSEAYNFQTVNNKMKLLSACENATLEVLSFFVLSTTEC
jgi:hypothetical protein